MPTAQETRDDLVATTPEAVRDVALERLKKRRDLKAHLVVYSLFNLAVWGIWVLIGASSHSWWPWPLFLTVFWGIGLAMNAWDVYFRRPITETELQREIDRLEHPHARPKL